MPPSREESFDTNPPLDSAAAERIRAETATDIPASRTEFFDQLIERRMAALDRRERALEEREETLRKRAEAISQLEADVLADMRRVRRECALEVQQQHASAQEEIQSRFKAAHEEVERRLKTTHALAEASKALAVPAKAPPSGAELLAGLGTTLITRGFDTLQAAFKANPAIAQQVADAATNVINTVTGAASHPEADEAPAAAPDDSGARADSSAPSSEAAAAPEDYSLEEFKRAVAGIPAALLQQLCETYGVGSPSEVTPEFMTAVVQAYRSQQAAS